MFPRLETSSFLIGKYHRYFIFFSISPAIKLNKPTFTPSKHSKWKTNTSYLSTNGHLEDRPREKMMEKGAAALSDAELLAILIGSGNTEESAVELMRRLLFVL